VLAPSPHLIPIKSPVVGTLRQKSYPSRFCSRSCFGWLRPVNNKEGSYCAPHKVVGVLRQLGASSHASRCLRARHIVMNDDVNLSNEVDRSATVTYDAFWHGRMVYAKGIFCNLSRLFERRLNWQRIFYIQFTNPGCYPPLHHSSRILANAGWDVLFFGTKSFGSSSILKLPPDPRIRLKIFSYPARGLLQLYYLWFCVRVVWKTFWWRPAWLYASDILSYPAALLASLLTGTRVILHEHDSPNHQSQVSRPLVWTRAQLARRAWLNILPSAPRAQVFRKETQASTVQVVWNCPLIQEMPFPKASGDRDSFVLYYHGNINPTLLPPTGITSLKLLPKAVVLRMVGYETEGNVGYSKNLIEAAASLGVADRVFVAPPVSRSELFELCVKGDVGLAFFPEPTGPADSYAGASNKVFDYLCCGMPVLTANTAEWQNFFRGADLALACEPSSPESIAASVLWFYNHREEARLMGERGRQKILQDWNYEAQFEPVLRYLKGYRDDSGQTDGRPECRSS
jgi:glycosyltransferase involved in cell wall biosynthesis